MVRATFDHTQNVHLCPVGLIRPAAVNGDIYRPVDPADPDVRRLADTIAEHGILHPLIVTTDHVILSGHRRFCAAKLAGLKAVPVLFDEIASTDDQFVQRLVVANTAREKTLDEVLRETVVCDATAEEAHEELLHDRSQRAMRAVAGVRSLIDMGATRKRAEISAGRWPFLEAVVAVIESMRKYWPLSDRSIHYQLLNNPPMRWTKRSKRAKKPSEPYRNDAKSYGDLTRLLTQARFEGFIPFEAIHDPTRPVTQWSVHQTAGEYVRESVDDFLRGYARDLLQSQPHHIEVVCEKNTLASVLRAVCMDYTLPLTIGRGYCSVPPRKAMFDRFVASGKDGLVLIVLSDHDPDGTTIAESLARSLRDDFKVRRNAITPVRAALTHKQVKDLGLPPNKETAKESSANFESFVRRYGHDVYELEAGPPATLQQMLRDAVDSVLDHDAFNAEVAREADDAREIKVSRQRVMAALGRRPQSDGE
jgi:hypothetical protein